MLQHINRIGALIPIYVLCQQKVFFYIFDDSFFVKNTIYSVQKVCLLLYFVFFRIEVDVINRLFFLLKTVILYVSML